MNKIKRLISFINGKIKQSKAIIMNQDLSIFNWYLFILFIGLVSSETFYFGSAIGDAIFAWAVFEHINNEIIKNCSYFLSIIVLSYICLRINFEYFYFYIKNIRISLPILLFFILGISISFRANGIFFEEYQRLISKVYLESLIIIATTPVFLGLIFSIFALSKLFQEKKSDNQPYFLNDNPITNLEDDLLDINKNAERFADLVLNQDSPDSLVFGIDSPWGIGKTSFINRCKDNWDKLDSGKRPIIVVFEPIKYLSQEKLSEKLANEISQALYKQSRSPILNSTFNKYINILKENSHISLFGMDFKLPTNVNYKTEFENLQNEIGELGRKIIIVIDDLDRLSWYESKKILYGIKQSFNIKNISFVLCYDTNNLSLNSQRNNDEADVVEFLEKFVNVKYTLFIDSAKMANLVSTDSEKLLKRIELGSPVYYDQIRNIIISLKSIYGAKDYYKYSAFCGDLRKVKRLINSLLMLNIQSLNIENSDIDGGDLIRLMMLYISFPQTFRRIYDSEMGGRHGNFSFKPSENAKGSYVNGSVFTEDLENEKYTKSEEIILRGLFDSNTLETDSLNESNRACFNGVGRSSRNLERYLDLIVKLRQQRKFESSRFYEGLKESFINGQKLAEILDSEDFNDDDESFGLDKTIKLLNLIGNQAETLDANKAKQIIEYIIVNIDKFSLSNRELLGTDSRSSLIYSLLKVINSGLWRVNGSYNNSNESLNIITDLIFGEGEFDGDSIINQFTIDSRLPLGFYDLLLFRLYCSADRANSLFNIHRALSIRYSKDAPIDGAVIEIARVGMRQISQAIFRRFSEAYIDTKRNFYSDVLNLGAEKLNTQASQLGDVLASEIEKSKSTVLGFVIYQLSNQFIQSGVGCGYYDPVGDEDNKQISKLMNNYLFDVCFNPDIDVKNIYNFHHYLLNHLSSPFDTGTEKYELRMEELTKVLDKGMLCDFWLKNRSRIIQSGLHERQTVFYNVNYEVSYKEYLPKVYMVLDSLTRTPLTLPV